MYTVLGPMLVGRFANCGTSIASTSILTIVEETTDIVKAQQRTAYVDDDNGSDDGTPYCADES